LAIMDQESLMQDSGGAIQSSPAKLSHKSLIPENYDRQFGFALACFSALLFAVSSYFVSEITSRCDAFSSLHLTVIRNFVQMALAGSACKYKGHPLLGRDAYTRKWLLFQALFFIIAITCFYEALEHLPLGDATVIFFINPAFAIMNGTFILKEPFTTVKFVSLVVCIAGVILTVHPSFLFDPSQNSSFTTTQYYFIIVDLIGALSMAFMYIAARFSRQFTPATSLELTLWCGGFGFISSLILLLVIDHDFEKLESLSVECWGASVGLGGLAFLADVSLKKSLGMIPSGITSIVRTSDIAWAYGFQILLQGQSIDYWSFAGAILVVLSAVVISFAKK